MSPCLRVSPWCAFWLWLCRTAKLAKLNRLYNRIGTWNSNYLLIFSHFFIFQFFCFSFQHRKDWSLLWFPIKRAARPVAHEKALMMVVDGIRNTRQAAYSGIYL